MKIKGLILDVDGVIVGDRDGFNYPLPHSDVLAALRRIRKRGIPVSTCTGKAAFAITELVRKARLDNWHAADGGASIVNPIRNESAGHVIPRSLVERALSVFQNAGYFVELYTAMEFYALKADNEKILKHGEILGRKPRIVASLQEIARTEEIIKIMPVCLDKQEADRLLPLFNEFRSDLGLGWGIHPATYPIHYAIITQKGVSKASGAKEVADKEGISLNHVLGVGDGMTDWEFMQHCGTVATLENAAEEVRDLVRGRGGIVSRSVDHNGILEILDHYDLR